MSTTAASEPNTVTQTKKVTATASITNAVSSTVTVQPSTTKSNSAVVPIDTTKTIEITYPGETVTVPSGTATTESPFRVTLCPAPTGGSAPLDPKSNLTFGCSPGYVCDPIMPDGCNFWPGPPPDDFICCPDDCIPAPPITTTKWKEGETAYYPPSYGYFNLNPEAFGLSYDIFEYEAVGDGGSGSYTTGNWESQASLSNWPRGEPTSSPGQGKRKAVRQIGKRGVTPAVCYDDCENAYLIVSSGGKRDGLCDVGSYFRKSYDACASCIASNEGPNKNRIVDYVEPQFAQFINFCDGDASTPTSKVPTGPDPAVTSLQPVETSGQVGASSTTFTPIAPSTTDYVSAPSDTPASQAPSSALDGGDATTTLPSETTTRLGVEVSAPASLQEGTSGAPGKVTAPVTANEGHSTESSLSTLDPSSASPSLTTMDTGGDHASPTSNGVTETTATQIPGSQTVPSGETSRGGTETLQEPSGSSRATPPLVINSAPAHGGLGADVVAVVCAVALALTI